MKEHVRKAHGSGGEFESWGFLTSCEHDVNRMICVDAFYTDLPDIVGSNTWTWGSPSSDDTFCTQESGNYNLTGTNGGCFEGNVNVDMLDGGSYASLNTLWGYNNPQEGQEVGAGIFESFYWQTAVPFGIR